MKKLIYNFLMRPVTTGMFLFCIILLGISAFFSIPIELTPKADFPRLSVSSSWKNASPEVIEASLTSPLEAALSNIKGISKISSRSSEGFCFIDLEFHPSTDMNFARLDVNEVINTIRDELPPGITPPKLTNYLPEEMRETQSFLTYIVSANLSANDIKSFIKENIQNKLLSVNGVSDIFVGGGGEKLISILIDYDKARAFEINDGDITSAVRDIEKIVGVGTIKHGNSQVSIRLENNIVNIRTIENQPVKRMPNGVIRIKDIGRVVNGSEERNSYYRINGKETVIIEIGKEPGVNTIKTADAVYKVIDEIKARLPKGLGIQKTVDKSEIIRDELNKLYKNILYSFLIVIVVLFLVFRSIKYSLIIIIAIIFSILLSFLLFFLASLSVNIITLTSITLGIGLIVDNSIIVIDYIERHYNNKGLKVLAVTSMHMFFPVLTSSLATFSVFLSLSFFSGEMSLYLKQFGLAALFSLISSLVAAFSIVPFFYVQLKCNSKLSTALKGGSTLIKLYEILICCLYKWKKTTAVFLMFLIGIPVWVLPRRIDFPVISGLYNYLFDSDIYNDCKPAIEYILGGCSNLYFNHIKKGDIWSYGEETYILVWLRSPNGNDIQKINEICLGMEKSILRYKKEFKNVSVKIPDEQNAFIKVEFPQDKIQSNLPYLMKNYLSTYAAQLGGINISIMGFGPGFQTGAEGDLSNFKIRITGFNYLAVKSIAENIRSRLVNNPRTDKVDIDNPESSGSNFESYEIAAVVDRNRILGTNQSIDDVLEVISKYTSPDLSHSKFRINNEDILYEVKYSDFREIQLDKLRNLLFKDKSKENSRIDNILNFELYKTMSTINRENRQYVRYVSFDFKGPSKIGEVFTNNLIRTVDVPEGYKIEKGKSVFEMNADEEKELFKIIFISVILIYIITAGLFESYKKPLFVLIAIPFSFIGSIILFYLGDFNFDRGAYAGLMLLVGLSVNNSIILIDYLSKNVRNCNIQEVISLSYRRFRPIFTTSLATTSALLPLVITPGNDFWKSLSLSVIGGIMFSAAVVVILIPLLFIYISGAEIEK